MLDRERPFGVLAQRQARDAQVAGLFLHPARIGEHQACDAALRNGEHPAFLVGKTWVLSDEEREAEMLPFLGRVLRISPHYRRARRRCWARMVGKDWKGAAEDLLLSRQLQPTEDWIARQTKWMVDKLRLQGHELHEAEQHEAAAEMLALGLQLAPEDDDLMRRQAWNLKQSGTPEAVTQARLAAGPDDFGLRLRFDHGWVIDRRFDLVV